MISQDELSRLHGELLRKNRLETLLPSLYRRREELTVKTQSLEKQCISEQADVDRLEENGLSSFFYGLLGKKEEKLEKERAEAAAAAAKYFASKRELSGVEADISAYETELSSLAGAEERYDSALGSRIEDIKRQALPGADELIELGESCARLDRRLREISEALSAGEQASGTASAILEKLGDAQTWGEFDLFCGGFISGLAKHSSLDSAQQLVPRLQLELGRLQSELSDVGPDADLDISADGFLRFADIFIDGFFSDLAALEHVHNARQSVERTASEIDGAVSRLRALSRELEEERGEVCRRMRELAAGEN